MRNEKNVEQEKIRIPHTKFQINKITVIKSVNIMRD